MNPLDLLKTQLQNSLNESTESEDFNEALHDCSYACNLSVTALEQHIGMWPDKGDWDIEYCRGIKFVEDKWHQITGMF
ncbi:hypothetical protein [Robertmurraya sp.]|uniref:hypothetical protein n=1 Tax=Robertmurraya sp. TaxID=2837525 RepID=UPI003704ADF2